MITTGKVIASALHLRAKPDAHSDIIATVPKDTIIHIDGEEGNWWRATYNFKRGYLYKSYVETLELPEPEPPSRYMVAIWTLLAAIVASGVAFIYGILGWTPH